MSPINVPWNMLETDRDRERWLADMPAAEMRVEFVKCRAAPWYFIHNYCQLYDKVAKRWSPFLLWPMQRMVVRDMHRHRLVVAMKARQEGLSWLGIGLDGLWEMLFDAIAQVGIFSKRDDEAVYMLGDERLKGMYKRLPVFLQAESIVKSDGHQFTLSNGSTARAFPTTGGDAYAMTAVILDEFDLVPDQNALMRAVGPTVDGGGKMVLLSRVDKDRPHTEFKRAYASASTKMTIGRDGTGRLLYTRTTQAAGNGWHAIFIPWFAHPDRNEAWYRATAAEIQARTGSTDDLFEQYPATEEEALAARALNKRIPPEWLAQCYAKMAPLPGPPAGWAGTWPAILELEVFEPPEAGRRYGVGLDPAEGLPSSDDSAIEVLDRETGEEVCALAGKYEPALAAHYAHVLAEWYNNAPIMVERNNHGHACLLWFREHSQLKVLAGFDHRPGWNDNSQGKALLYDDGAAMFHDGRTTVHSERTKTQIGSIEAATLRAPQGDHDDRAVAYMLAGQICKRKPAKRKARSYQG